MITAFGPLQVVVCRLPIHQSFAQHCIQWAHSVVGGGIRIQCAAQMRAGAIIFSKSNE
jgi:hypothetical protein